MKVNTHHARVEQSHSHRAGFTLVEMLVVIAIIGILTAVLVPVIGGALRTAREATVKNDLKNIETSLENYKAKTQVYPVDFGNPFAIYPHATKLSARLGSANLIIDTTDTSPYGELDNITANDGTWYNADLVNPHRGPGGLSESVTGIAGGISPRRPNTIDAAESWVFWLFETTNNPAYPLGAVFNGTNWVLDPEWNTVWEANRFMEFDLKRFSDRDSDGWFEYLPPSADEDFLAPYVYFDSRTYTYQNRTLTTPADAAEANVNVRRRAVYPAQRLPQSAFVAPPDLHVGIAQPYVDVYTNAAAFTWYEPKKFQVIAAGLDDHFSDHDPVPAYTWDNPATFKVVPGKSQPQGRLITREDRDNIVSFLNDRVDKNEE